MNEKSLKMKKKKTLKFERKLRKLILKERDRFSTTAGGALRENNVFYLKKNIIKKEYNFENGDYQTKIYKDAKCQTNNRSWRGVEKNCLFYNHDFQDIELSLAECSICLELFSWKNPAMVTTCSHVFCRTCAYKMMLEFPQWSSNGQEFSSETRLPYGQIKCPICRTYLYADSFSKISYPSLRAMIPDERTNACSFLEALKNIRLEKCHSNLNSMIEIAKKLRRSNDVNALPRLAYKISIQKRRKEYCTAIGYDLLLNTLNETKQYLNESLIMLEKIMQSINSPHKNLSYFNISEFAMRVLTEKNSIVKDNL